jgi:dimethylglycine dehydrogenase
MRTHTSTVIIGGGVMGCSLAYHLCKEGCTDVVLLEKAELTSGSTWHAAGQVTHSVSHYGLAAMNKYATGLYRTLEAETGQSCSWHGSGSLRLAYEPDEVDWLHYTVSIGRGLDLPMEVIGPDEIARLHPFYKLGGVRAALHTPDDGHVDPAGVAMAMAKGARMMGAEVVRFNRATGISRAPGGEWIVHTEHGDITCERVVNAGGTYARQIGLWLGLDLPIANLMHHYLVTEPVPEFENLDAELPVVRDDRMVSGYIRMEQRSGLIGIYEKANAATVWDHGTPWEAVNELFEPDYERIMPWLENAMARMPVLANLGIRRVVHGAITHPPDGNMMLGPAPGLANVWLCCASQIGIAWGPGAGRYLAQWMVHGAADISMRAFDPRRFGPWYDDSRRIGKAKEDYLLRHNIPYPGLDRPACRPMKVSSLYEPLKQAGAVYEEVFGWERPHWFAPAGTAVEHIHAFRRTRLHDIVGAECRAVRKTAGLADISAFAKLEIAGPDAAAFLERMTANRLPGRPGAMVLTHLLLANGRIEGEATLLRLAEDRFYMVFAAARELAMCDWLVHNRRTDEGVTVENVSERIGIIMLAGPNSRDVLAAATEAPLDNEAFGWLTGREIAVARRHVRALRVSYTGELGWELHAPMADLPLVYHALVEAGQPHGLVHVGSAALNALRLEKAYRSGHELSNDVTLAEAGMTRFARLDKDSMGAETTRREAAEGPKRWALAYLEVGSGDGEAVAADPLGGESVWDGDRVVGSISSAAYGHCVGRSLAFAYVHPDSSRPGTELDILVLGRPRRARVLDRPAWDPEDRRPRA